MDPVNHPPGGIHGLPRGHYIALHYNGENIENIFYSETKKTKSFYINFIIQHCYVELYVNLTNYAPGVNKWPLPVGH